MGDGGVAKMIMTKPKHTARLLYNHTYALSLSAAMSSAPYQPLPSDDHDEEASPNRRRYIPEHIQLAQDPRFSPPPPAWWKRALVILFIISMFWLYFSLRASMQRGAESQITHAERCVHNEIPVFFSRFGRWHLLSTPKIFKATQVSPRGQPYRL